MTIQPGDRFVLSSPPARVVVTNVTAKAVTFRAEGYQVTMPPVAVERFKRLIVRQLSSAGSDS